MSTKMPDDVIQLKKALFYSDLGKLKTNGNDKIKLSAIPFVLLKITSTLVLTILQNKIARRRTKYTLFRVIHKFLKVITIKSNVTFNESKVANLLSPTFERFYVEIFRYFMAMQVSDDMKGLAARTTLTDLNNKNNLGLLEQTGVIEFDVSSKDTLNLQDSFSQDVENIIGDKKTRSSKRQFDRSRRLANDDIRRNLVSEIFEKSGLFDTASAYCKYKLGLGDIILHVSQHGDEHHFETGNGLEPTDTINYHFDPKFGRLKVILYLSNVNHLDGPFEYIPGSHTFEDREFTRLMWMKAFSITNYLDDEFKRTVFNAFPLEFRRTAIFGSILQNRIDLQRSVMKNSVSYLSQIDQAKAILFDPNGFHRGGFVKEPGRSRVNLQITLVPTDQTIRKHLA